MDKLSGELRDVFTRLCEEEQGNCTYCPHSIACNKIFGMILVKDVEEEYIQNCLKDFLHSV